MELEYWQSHPPKWKYLNYSYSVCVVNNLRVDCFLLPGCLLMLFTVGLCGLRSALSYICRLRSDETSSSFPPVIPVYAPHPPSPQTFSSSLFFWLRFFFIFVSQPRCSLFHRCCSACIATKLIHPSSREAKDGGGRVSGLFPSSSKLSGSWSSSVWLSLLCTNERRNYSLCFFNLIKVVVFFNSCDAKGRIMNNFRAEIKYFLQGSSHGFKARPNRNSSMSFLHRNDF